MNLIKRFCDGSSLDITVFLVQFLLILLQCWNPPPPHILYWICESCLCLCPGTCLPSRSNRMFPVDVWPAMTPVPHWWSPILSSVSSSGLSLKTRYASLTQSLSSNIVIQHTAHHCKLIICVLLWIPFSRMPEHNLAGLLQSNHIHHGARKYWACS